MPQALRDCVEANNDVLVVQPALGEVRENLQGVGSWNKVFGFKLVKCIALKNIGPGS